MKNEKGIKELYEKQSSHAWWHSSIIPVLMR
jgi:hypothetical protein